MGTAQRMVLMSQGLELRWDPVGGELCQGSSWQT